MEISAQSIRIQWCSEVLILPAVLSMEDSARKELKDSVHAHRNNMGEWYLLKVVWQSVTSHEQHLWPGAIPDYTHQTRPPLTLSFLSCLAYGNVGMTAVTLQAEAILQAFIMMSSSISISFTSPQPLCTMYTSSPRTDSPISTLQPGNA